MVQAKALPVAGRRSRVLFSQDDTRLVCGAEFRSDGTVSPWVGSKALGGYQRGHGR